MAKLEELTLRGASRVQNPSPTLASKFSVCLQYKALLRSNSGGSEALDASEKKSILDRRL